METQVVRSISLPSRSHPLAQRFEEELLKLKTWESSSSSQQPTSEALCVGIEALSGLYTSVENLLRMPQAQHAVRQDKHEKWVADELDGSLRLLDVCSSTRDALSSIKEHSQDLQSTLRTRGVEDPIVKGKIQSYRSSRKNINKGIEKFLKTLKHADQRCEEDDLIVSALRETRAMSVIIYRSIFLFLSKTKTTNGWSSISKAIRRGRKVACEEGTRSSEIENVDASLLVLCKKCSSKDVEVEKLQSQLRGLEVGVDNIEKGLDYLFQRMISNRVSLLNIANL